MDTVVITEFMDANAVESLKKEFNVIYDKTLVDKKDELMKLIPTCSAIIVRNKTQVRGELLDATKELRVVGRLGVGLDNIDLPACKSRNITVIPATGANNVSVAEYVMAALLMLARGCYQSLDEVAQVPGVTQDMIDEWQGLAYVS